MADGVSPELSGRAYVALQIDNRNYIKVLPLEQTYLVQRPYQTVTASRQSAIPKAAERQLNKVQSMPDGCEQRTLYLSSLASNDPT